MKRQTTLLCILLTLSLSLANLQTTIKGTILTDDSFTKYSVTANPNFQSPTGIAVKGAHVTVDRPNATVTAEGVGFTFVSPPNDNNAGDLGFYYGYFTAQGQIDLQAKSASISASLVELVANFPLLYVYYDRNGQPGLQYNLQDPLDCLLAPATSDCFDLNFLYAKSLKWAPITVDNSTCPAGYADQCRIYIFTATTTGTDAGILTLALKISSQPVFIDDILITPDYGKIDITIDFPWSRYTLKSNPKVGIAVGTAGKTSTASASLGISRLNGKSAIQFSVNGKVGTFTWEDTATVTVNKKRSTSVVYHDIFSGDDIKNFQCPTGQICLLAALLKPLVTAWNLFGWKVSFLLFSWDEVQPTSVYWDPGVGNPGGSNAGMTLSATGGCLWVVMVVYVWGLLFDGRFY